MQRDLSGTLSRNKKRENDRQPEFKGACTIDGVAFWISAWLKEGEDGKFFSLAFTPKEKRSTAPAGVSAPGGGHRRGVPDDEMPFSPEFR
jgi:hypothetical protein